MPQTTPRRVIIALILILILAACLRTYGLRSLVYSNPDDALFSYFIVRVAGLSPLAPEPVNNAVANLLSWDYGWPLYSLDYVYLRALTALGLPVYEATLALPTATLGVLGCLLLYLLGTRFGSRRAGLIAAALMATMPLLVGRSRSVGGAEACAGFLFLLAALQIARYYEQPESRKRQWVAGLCLGLYLCGDVQMAIGGTVLLLQTIFWPRPPGYEGFAGWRRLVIRWGTLLPPLVLFAPYIPVYLYALHLGYGTQTYLGTMLGEHKAIWGFHFAEFLTDLSRNMGYLPLLLVPLAWTALRGRFGEGRLRWLLCWIALTAFPFLFAITGKVTEASGYHEHVATGLALLLAVGLAALRPRSAGTIVAAIAVAAALFFTTAGVLRPPSLVPYWPEQKVPYGGLPPNNGMKTAGYWVRQHVPASDRVFIAHDPAIAGWYLGREAIIGGYGAGMERTPSFLRVKDKVSVAIIPGQQEFYPPSLFAQSGFPGRIIVRSGGREVLSLYTRRPQQQILDTEQYDPLYTAAYHTPTTIVPPGSPYVPGKRVQLRQ
jgi:hypothetical protein